MNFEERMNLLEQKKQTQLLRFFDELNDTQKLTLTQHSGTMGRKRIP